MQKISLRIGDIELRTCDKSLLSKVETHTTAEIIIWLTDEKEKAFCIVLAYWIKDKEGFNLHFVGDRPFRYSNDNFWRIAKFGQEYLNEVFTEEEEC